MKDQMKCLNNCALQLLLHFPRFAMEVDYEEKVDEDHKFWFKVDNLKLMPGTYDVAVSKGKISHFKNVNVDIEYFIALEPESYFG